VALAYTVVGLSVRVRRYTIAAMLTTTSGIVLRMIIRKVNVASAAKVGGTLYAIFGLIFGIIFALIAMAGAGLATGAQNDPEMPRLIGTMFGAMFGVGAIVALPVFYGVMGLIFGALTAALYNMVAGITGGLSIDVD
jgi:hypothetical protein